MEFLATVLSGVVSLFSISDRIRKNSIKKDEVGTVLSRFIKLFEKHGVNRNQIPRFFGHKLELEDINNEGKLSSKLTHEMLQAACDMFAVRLEWLEGVDDQLYDIHDFYKHPDEYGNFLSQFNTDEAGHIVTKLILSTDQAWREDALLIIEEQIGLIGDKYIVRHHLCGGWIHKYWKCRADLAACIAMTLKQHVFIRGSRVNGRIDGFCIGEGFISDLNELPRAYNRNWLFKRKYTVWNPEEWIFDPISFVDGISEGDLGKASALSRWLDYFVKGYMKTGYGKDDSKHLYATMLKNIVE